MQLACNDVVPGLGCDYVAAGSDADAVHAAMMQHGGTIHANLLADLPPEEVAERKEAMDQRIRQLIVEHN